MAEKTSTKIGYVIIIILAFLAIIFIVPELVEPSRNQNVVDYETMQDFNNGKESILQLLRDSHSDCILAKTIPIIQEAKYGFAVRNPRTLAWTDPNPYAPVVVLWMNAHTKVKWTEDARMIATIHEALHWVKDKKGNYVCGPDKYRRRVGGSKIPVCKPFGTEVYDSEELTTAIILHLGKVTLAKKE